MKTIILSDLHAHNWSSFSTRDSQGRNTRLVDCLNVLDQAAEAAVKHNAPIAFLGDLFHSRSRIDVDVINHVHQKIYDITRRNVWVYLLRGNHDCYDNQGYVDSLCIFNHMIGVTVAREIMEGDWYVLVPWHWNTEELLEKLSKIDCKNKTLFIHQAVREGAIGAANHRGVGELSVKDLPIDRCKMIFAGDFHKHQVLANGRFMYVGSPLQLNFGEAGEDKYLILYDTDTGKIEKIPTNAPKFYSFEGVKRWKNAVSKGEVDPNRDFVKVMVGKEETDQAIAAVGKSMNVCVEQVQETVVEDRCSRKVLSDDSALVYEYVSKQETQVPGIILEAEAMEALDV